MSEIPFFIFASCEPLNMVKVSNMEKKVHLYNPYRLEYFLDCFPGYTYIYKINHFLLKHKCSLSLYYDTFMYKFLYV